LEDNSSVLTNAILEKVTRFFPYLEDETILFSNTARDYTPTDLQRLLEPIKSAFSQEELSDQQLETCIALISRIHQSCNQNEVRLFPELADEPAARGELYKKLWSELFLYARLAGSSPHHQRIIHLMEKLGMERKSVPGIGDSGGNSSNIHSNENNDNNSSSNHSNLQTNSSRASSSTTTATNINNNNNNNNSNDTRNHQLHNKSSSLVHPLRKSAMRANEGDRDHQGTYWSQLELMQTEVEKSHWIQVDPSQRPAMEALQQRTSYHESKKRKRAGLEIALEQSDPSSLFARYWSYQWQHCQPKELDGRLEKMES